MNTNLLVYLIIAGVVCFILAGFIVEVSRKKAAYTKSILHAMLCGFIEMPIYAIFLVTKNYNLAYVCRGLCFIVTEWLTLFFVKFAYAYALVPKKKTPLIITMYIISGLDSLFFISNFFVQKFYHLSFVQNLADTTYYYWQIYLPALSLIHFVICYTYIVISVIVLLKNAKIAPSFYKMKYIGLLFAYLVVIIVHLICFFIKSHIDFSVLLYGFMGAFVSFFITYTAPTQLNYQILLQYSDSVSDAVLYFDEHEKVIFANKTAKGIFTRDGDFSESVASEYCSSIISRFVKVKQEKTDFMDSIIVNGEVRDFEGEFQDFFDDRNQLGSFLRLRDKTAELARYKQQQYLASNDPLTDIPNREYFFEQVEDILQKDPYTPRLMLCSNICDFKLVNEVLGLEVGDEILKKLADLLKRFSRADDIFCRIGADKFAMFMRKSLFDPQVFIDGFKAVQKLSESEFFQLKLEIGVYEVRGNKESAQVIYDKAVMALDNKSETNNLGFYYYDSNFMEKNLEERNLVHKFEDDLEKDKFKLYFRPIQDKKKNVIALESDSKWLQEDGSMKDSSEYKPILQKYGVVYRLDRYIWEQAIKTAAQYVANSDKNIKILLNVSVKDSYYIDVDETIINLAKKYNLDPQYVIISVLEESISSNFHEVNESFKLLTETGFKILINEFGHGQTSLNLLKDTRLDYVKIDSRFVNNLEDDVKTKSILEFMISLSKTLGLILYTDGVDFDYQYKYLSELTIDGFSGDYCGKELPADSVVDFYK